MFRNRHLLLSALSLFFCLNISAQWKRSYTGKTNDLYDIRQYGHRAYTCGQSSTLLFSSDTGKTWKSINVTIPGNFRTLHFFDSMTGIITGENARVQKTLNGGSTWSQKYARTAAYAYNMAFSGDSGYLVGKDFLIASSNDRGESWQVDTTADIRKQLNGACITPDHKCWAVGDSGYILRKHLWQKKWHIIKFPSTINFTSVNAISEGKIVIVGGMQDTANVGKHFNIVLMSVDSGQSWISSSVPEMKTIYTSVFFSADTGFFAGTNGIISKVYEPLNKRGQQLTGISSGINRISYSAGTALAAGDGGIVLRTSNRGGYGVSIKSIQTPAGFKAYPQPSSGTFRITAPEGYALKNIWDPNGKKLSFRSEENQITLNEQVTGLCFASFENQSGETVYLTLSFN